MKIGSLFSGYGGLDIAVESFFRAETVWHAEWEDAPSKVLAHHWPGVPNFRDVSQVDWSAVEPVDIITGGFPCQDVSMAGKRAGMVEGTRSNLWGAMRTAVETIRPRYVVAENVRGLLSATAQSDSDLELDQGFMGDGTGDNLRAIGRVLGDLADIGYDAKWYGLRAADIGAPHNRFRVFILATDARGRCSGQRVTAPRQETRWRPSSESGGLGRAQAVTDTGSPVIRQHTERSSTEETRSASGGGFSDTHGERPAVNWGPYQSAIRQWEERLGRLAPPPTQPSATGRQQLSPVFVEWMMGLDEGQVTGIEGASRAQQLNMLGNGVVPQQAYEALRRMKVAA